jgi:GWxTD domain-containing protein
MAFDDSVQSRYLAGETGGTIGVRYGTPVRFRLGTISQISGESQMNLRTTLTCSLLILLIGSMSLAGEPEEQKLPDWKLFSWQDLSMIMSVNEEVAFERLETPADLEKWVRAFWLRRDPTPTTGLNERRELHLKRLENARDNFSADNQCGLDQRGRDYLLFGPPDETITVDTWFDETGYHPARETWIWVDHEMRSTYSDWNLDGEWEHAWDELPSSRPDVAVRLEKAYMQSGEADDAAILGELRMTDPDSYMRLVRQLNDGELINPLEVGSDRVIADLMSSKFRKMEDNYLNNREERVDPYRHDFRVDPLWAAFAVDCFRGDDRRSRVELTHQVRCNDLTFRWDLQGQVFQAELLRRISFFDAELKLAASSEERIPVGAENLDDTQAAILIPGLAVTFLPPGRYEMALRLEDTGSGKLQIYRTIVQVPEFPADRLQTSDITFATAMEISASPGIFGKGDWNIYPHPFRVFNPDGEINIYFEIYGLGTDDEGLNNYRVTYRIKNRSPQIKSGWLWTKRESFSPEVASTFVDRRHGSTTRHPLSISAANFNEDSYILDILVEDLISGQETETQTRFSVVPPSSMR